MLLKPGHMEFTRKMIYGEGTEFNADLPTPFMSKVAAECLG